MKGLNHLDNHIQCTIICTYTHIKWTALKQIITELHNDEIKAMTRTKSENEVFILKNLSFVPFIDRKTKSLYDA